MMEDRQVTIIDQAGNIIFDLCDNDIICVSELPVFEQGDNILVKIPVVLDVEKKITFRDNGGWTVVSHNKRGA